MPKSKAQTTSTFHTQIMPVLHCSNEGEVDFLMDKLGTVRAVTYNQLGSLKGWGLHWQKADKLIRKIIKPEDLKIPAKLFEWSVNDCMKAINAQQEAAKVFLIKEIYRKFKSEGERKEIINLLHNSPTSNPWLHRHFRKQYIRGHTYQHNQIVYQKAGYTATKISRYRVKLEIQGIQRGKRMTLIIKSNRLPTGQIRLIRLEGCLEIHTGFKKPVIEGKKPQVTLGLDKGYTEGFYLYTGEVIAEGLGKKLTAKTERINKENKNRNRLRSYAKGLKDKSKRDKIFKHNLTSKKQSRKLARDKAEIQNLIRSGLRKTIQEPTIIYAEDLTSPIKTKHQSKRINRRLNSWIKGELQDSLEAIGKETGSTVKTVNPAYTSQMDCLTGTLLGCRNGDCFIRYTGEVLQSDYNAAKNILCRGTDEEISRFMKAYDVLVVLLHRTVRYLAENGYSVKQAIDNGWLQPKFQAGAEAIQSIYPPKGYGATIKAAEGEYIQLELPLFDTISNKIT